MNQNLSKKRNKNRGSANFELSEEIKAEEPNNKKQFNDFLVQEYGYNYIKTLTDYEESTKKLISPYHDLDFALDGGFSSGRIYEINGTSLTGKTTLVNNIVSRNPKSKIFFFDTLGTNFFQSNRENDKLKVIYIEVANDLVKKLEKILEEKTKVDLIIIDSLTLLISKELKLEEASIFSLSKILNLLCLRNDICIIYTCNIKRFKEESIFNFETDSEILMKQTDTLLPPQFVPLKQAEISLFCNSQLLSQKRYYMKITSKSTQKIQYIEISN